MSVFVSRLKLRSSHCGPSGKLQVSRYFELVNRVVEEWFGGPLDFSFAAMHDGTRQVGIPTVRLELEVGQVVSLGEELRLSLQLVRAGRSSIELIVIADCEEQARFNAKVVLVLTDTSGVQLRGLEIPPALREAMNDYLVDSSLSGNTAVTAGTEA
ncbi:acyl-CoA thioesterase [Marinobacter orientalis]|uniref:Acyl-CoA thioesterase n=1 Tax=Marinobacter orientalis TaxID=1928859 RepID=A0A7Y0RAC0_9GAMM|nr:acyl-CoA thioesterase [Marinobacter orientalis]NMT62729.1 acyl-CoA thioesterase [Marinobacter orientalis]TGX51412.1 acyl-CoA thioesterase [Marinobacter orientalis]